MPSLRQKFRTKIKTKGNTKSYGQSEDSYSINLYIFVTNLYYRIMKKATQDIKFTHAYFVRKHLHYKPHGTHTLHEIIERNKCFENK